MGRASPQTSRDRSSRPLLVTRYALDLTHPSRPPPPANPLNRYSLIVNRYSLPPSLPISGKLCIVSIIGEHRQGFGLWTKCGSLGKWERLLSLPFPRLRGQLFWWVPAGLRPAGTHQNNPLARGENVSTPPRYGPVRRRGAESRSLDKVVRPKSRKDARGSVGYGGSRFL